MNLIAFLSARTQRRLLGALLMVHSLGATAIDYTDIWYTAAEPGWGVNVVQSGNFMFATFFVYAQGGTPTWYTGQLNWDGSTKFSGALYASTGTYFAAPWVAANGTTVAAGTVSFEPANAHEGTLVYTVNGAPSTVTKTIQRQTLTTIPLGGLYAGGQSGSYSQCTNSGSNGNYIDRYDLEVTHLAGGSATFRFKYTGGLVCTLSGAIQQHGQLYRIPSATYVCSNGLNTSAIVYEIKATGQGVEGRFDAPSIGGGCRETGRFAAVL
jgi:hypothetical protein